MEAVEDTTLEAAIGWLADTILANLPAGGKLDSWIREAGLGNDVEKLKSEVEAVEMVVSAVQGRAARNKPLAKSLALVKELLYDADDVVDELDHYRLQQELQPETLLETDGHGTQQVERSSESADDVQNISNGRLRSKEWVHFDIIESEQNGGPSRARCKYCRKEIMCNTKMGTSVLRNHLKSKGCSHKRGATEPSSSTADATTIPTPVVAGSRKRMRTGQESIHIIAANPNGWNKDEFSERIQDITSQLQVKHEAITRLLKVLPSDSVGASSSHCQTTISDPRQRTSGLFHGKVYGRAAEKRSIKKLIKKHKSTAGVTVLPIVGIGGVGKTALAQLVYNDSAVENHFGHKIWIWVSKDFDEMRLTREMLDCVSQETYDVLCSFTKLQEVLKDHIKSKRVLLILDDLWEVMDDCRWNKLLAPFKSDDGANGNMIILTTRKLSVAKKRGTIEPIYLDGLTSDHFWLFFKACAFGDENCEEQASLSDLGHEIAKKLKGNPLAAQTVGALLRDHLTVDHWSNILKTKDWKSLQHTGGIMSALKLSYDELPYPVQQCYSYCSIFPYGCIFLAEELVRLWILQGFVKRDHSSKSLQEVGRYYLTDLVNLGLFEKVERERSSLGSQSCYAMPVLMHDFARLVSRTECATLDGFQCNEILPNVHHLSIVTSSVYWRDDQTGNIPRNEKFEFFLQNIVTTVRKLRTLLLIGEYDSFFFKEFQDVFGKAHNLRLLQMSATSTDFNSFLCSLVNPTRLRYLKLHDVHTEQRPLLSLVNPTCLWDPKLHIVHTKHKALPHVLSKFFRLQVLDVASFMSLHTVHLEDCREWRIVPSLEILQFLKRLKLSNMLRVREVSVPSLEELVLYGMPDLQRCSCTSVKDMKFTLRVLEIQSCPALEVFDLFQRGDNFEIEHKTWLPSLKRLIMCDCPHLQVQIPLPPSATFFELLINRVSAIMTMDGSSMGTFKIIGERIWFLPSSETMPLDHTILAFHNLKDIKYLEISSCTDLTYISFQGLSQLISLQRLKIVSCGKLFSSDDVPEHTHEDMITATGAALQFLESLCIRDCEITGKWLSLMLRHSPTLKELDLYDCPQLKLLTTEEKGKIQPNLLPASEASSSGYLDDALRSSVRASSGYVADAWPISVVDGVVHIPLNLKKITINRCPYLIFDGSKEGFAGFTSLEKEVEEDGQENGRFLIPQLLEQLVWSNYSRKTLRPCFVGNLTCLRKLEVTSGSLEYLQLDSCTALEDLQIEWCEQLVALHGMQSLGTLRSLVLYKNSSLESLQLHSCTALERLEIQYCSSLVTVTLEGMESLVNLKHLEIHKSPALDSLTALESIGPTEGISSHSQELFPALESLDIDVLSSLTTSFCKGLTCLRSLTLGWLNATRLTDEQEDALLLLKSLQKLSFEFCQGLVDLPAGLHDLPSLRTLKIIDCNSISGLPKKGLPPSLEELVIEECSDELTEACRALATSKLEDNSEKTIKLEVKINGHYVD